MASVGGGVAQNDWNDFKLSWSVLLIGWNGAHSQTNHFKTSVGLGGPIATATGLVDGGLELLPGKLGFAVALKNQPC